MNELDRLKNIENAAQEYINLKYNFDSDKHDVYKWLPEVERLELNLKEALWTDRQAMDNKMTKNEWLATKVMGWYMPNHGAIYKEENYYDDKKCIVIKSAKLDWNPLENIDQAFMLLNKFNGMVQIGRGEKPDWWNVSLNGKNHFVDDSLTVAISEAILVYSGYYNE